MNLHADESASATEVQEQQKQHANTCYTCKQDANTRANKNTRTIATTSANTSADSGAMHLQAN